MAPVAIDPHRVVNDVSRSAHDIDPDAPPVLLGRPTEPGPELPAMHEVEALQKLHQQWQDAHRPPAQPSGAVQSARQRAGTLARNVSSLSTRERPQEDRALIGRLIQVVDLLASRCDELADRLHRLESALDEVSSASAEELTRIRAALAGRQPQRRR